MTSKGFQGRDKLGLLTFALCAILCPRAHAEWGSIRANNRGQREFRAQPSAREAAPRAEHQEAREAREHEAPRFGERERGVVPERGREGEHHWEEEARERRHLDIDEDRRHGYFWSGISPGVVFGTLPSGYVPLTVGSAPYYYYGGAFYEQSPSGYVAVNPPVGAVVPALPPGAEPISVGPNVYYYAGGAFYLQGPQGFSVVPPPLGVTVSVLPPGAAPVYVNGVLYYQYDGVYFLPGMQDGVVVYTTVQP